MSNSHIVAEVTANIEIDIDKLIDYLVKDGMDIEDITMDTIFYTIQESIGHLKPKNGCSFLETATDGPTINGFADRTYDRIEKRLEERQENG